MKQFNSIHDKFLSNSSESKVNVSHHARRLVEKERHSKKIDVNTSKTLIDFLKRDVCNNLIDSYQHFIQTLEYKQWREMKCMQKLGNSRENSLDESSGNIIIEALHNEEITTTGIDEMLKE